ncbi:MAG: hypothetical protein ACRD9L_11280, partial [Bryobacteraceae bacterium]
MTNPETSNAQLEDGAPAGKTSASAAGKRRKGRWLIWLTILCLLAAGAYLIFPRVSQGQSGRSKSGRSKGSQTISVVASKVRKGNLPIYLNGLG